MRKLLSLTILASGLIWAGTTQAQDVVGKWYEALKSSDRAAFAMILSDNAQIEVTSLGLVQSKSEFIDALDNWEDVAKDLELVVGDMSATSDGKSVVVCYRFASNSFTNRETFTLSEGKVGKQVQDARVFDVHKASLFAELSSTVFLADTGAALGNHINRQYFFQSV